MKTWQLQEAKARLSEVIKKAADEGPQRITVRGRAAAVVMSGTAYRRLLRKPGSFLDFMRRSPLYGVELDIRREQTPDRMTDME